MGCINSTKKLNDFKSDVFRVRCTRLNIFADYPRNGYLELSKKELCFVPQGSREPIVWALQHLRRYGLNGNVFSFEAGRRCMSGPGIYTFRCQNGERLYQLFQRYVNAQTSLTNDEIFGTNSREHPSHSLGRPDNPHSNNYLEPAPLSAIAATHRIQALQESFSSSPLSLLDSPDSIPSLSFTNEMINFPSSNSSHHQTAGATSYGNANAANSNLYLEHPLRSHAVASSSNQVQRFFGSGSTNSTLQRRTLMKRSSLDAPPEECAPILTPVMTPGAEAMHMYANVETGQGLLLSNERSGEKTLDPSERCYENLSRLDLPLLLQSPLNYQTRDDPNNATKEKEQQLSQQHQQQQQQTPTTPGGVNYIDLDLPQSSPKTCFGSGLSLITGERSESASMDLQSPPLTAGLTTSSLKENDDPPTEPQMQQQQKSESSLGYSTIDFIKTCALIKSSTHGADFDLDHEHDQEESRITRHSKCVRKAYSISE